MYLIDWLMTILSLTQSPSPILQPHLSNHLSQPVCGFHQTAIEMSASELLLAQAFPTPHVVPDVTYRYWHLWGGFLGPFSNWIVLSPMTFVWTKTRRQGRELRSSWHSGVSGVFEVCLWTRHTAKKDGALWERRCHMFRPVYPGQLPRKCGWSQRGINKERTEALWGKRWTGHRKITPYLMCSLLAVRLDY